MSKVSASFSALFSRRSSLITKREAFRICDIFISSARLLVTHHTVKSVVTEGESYVECKDHIFKTVY